MKGWSHVLYHLGIVVLSAGTAVALPLVLRLIAKKLLIYWGFVQDETIFLVGLEVSTALLLIVLFNLIGKSWRDAKLSRLARRAGIEEVLTRGGSRVEERTRRLKERHGFAKDVCVISSTGFRTFADHEAELRRVLRTCREARVLLLDPYANGASLRARSLLSPEVTVDHFRGQIRKSIEFLGELKAGQKRVALKLYPDAPFLKIAILGDYIWMQHYQTGLDLEAMPQYVFRHDQAPGGLYAIFYQYFMARWNDPGIPEYDFDTAELVYRDGAGKEVRRGKFGAS